VTNRNCFPNQQVIAWALLTVWTIALCSTQETTGNDDKMPEVSIENGQKIAFLGDYATTENHDGYPFQVIRGLEANGINASLLLIAGAGSSDQMLAKLNQSVLVKQPDWLIINCGASAAWAQRSADQYQRDINQMVEKAQAAGTKVMLTTANPAGEDPDTHYGRAIAAYNERLRELAKEKKYRLADVDMASAITAAGGGHDSHRGNVLTTDGVFLNTLGTQIMTLDILKTLGLNPAQLQKAQDSWLDLTNFCSAKASLTIRQYMQLDALAAKQHRSAQELLGEMTAKALSAQSKDKPELPPNRNSTK